MSSRSEDRSRHRELSAPKVFALVLFASCLLGGSTIEGGAAAETRPPVEQQSKLSDARASGAMGLYLNLCSGCHNEDMTGDRGPPLIGPTFSERWSGRPSDELEKFILTSMPADNPGSLSADKAKQLADLLNRNIKPKH